MEFVIDVIAADLSKLHTLVGAEFIRQLERITLRNEFHQLSDSVGIYVTGELHGEDSAALLNAARKAVTHGYTVYILPNPKGIRTADFIFFTTWHL